MKPPRRLLPTLLLVSALAVTSLTAFSVYRSERAQKEVLRGVLSDYAEFASWSYTQHLEDALRNAGAEVLGHVNHVGGLHMNPQTPDSHDLLRAITTNPCYCYRPAHGLVPSHLLGFEIGSDSLGATPYHERPPHESGPVPAAVARESLTWIGDSIRAAAHRQPPPASGYSYHLSVREGSPTLVSYTLMRTAWGDTIVYAAVYPEAAVRGLLGRILDDQTLLPPVLTANSSNREIISLAVAAEEDGHDLFRSGALVPEWELESTDRIAEEYGGMRVRVQIRPEAANALVVGGAPRSRLPLLLGLLVLAGALTIGAVGQLMKQDQLARERTDFVAGVSHELRTPLAQIRLFLDTILLGRAETPEARRWSLEQMDRETRRLVHLVDNVLVFSTGPSKMLAATRQRLDLRQEVDSVATEFGAIAAARRSWIETSGDHVEVESSRDALRHILLNLLDNAVKYGPAGQTIAVHVGVAESCARIEVVDQGPGVSEEERPRIWEAFYRGRTGLARAAGGSGIGLHLVRALAVGLGGGVEYSPAPGGGARFVVYLPMEGFA